MAGLTLCVLLWVRDGHEVDFIDYEDHVLRFLPDHGAQVLQRARASAGIDQPFEVHLLMFPSEGALNSYMSDARRTALSDDRERAIARTEILRVAMVPSS